MARDKPWVPSTQPPWLANSDPTPCSTYEAQCAWNQGDALQKYYRDAASVRNFSRRGAWGALAPRPPGSGIQQTPLRLAPSTSLDERQAAFKQAQEKELISIPGGTGASRVEYMKADAPEKGRLFNVASRGLPSGAQPKWSFDRMPSLLPPPLMRDRGVARSCAGMPPRVEPLLPRADSNPDLVKRRPGMLPPLLSQSTSAPSLT
jgi:hypothetical protein